MSCTPLERHFPRRLRLQGIIMASKGCRQHVVGC